MLDYQLSSMHHMHTLCSLRTWSFNWIIYPFFIEQDINWSITWQSAAHASTHQQPPHATNVQPMLCHCHLTSVITCQTNKLSQPGTSDLPGPTPLPLRVACCAMLPSCVQIVISSDSLQTKNVDFIFSLLDFFQLQLLLLKGWLVYSITNCGQK